MAIEEKEELNKTQGEEIRIPCSHCSGMTSHKVVFSVDKSGSYLDGGGDFYWEDHYQIVQCQGCKTISFRHYDSNSEDFVQISKDEWECNGREYLYPPRIAGRKGIEDVMIYLPYDVQRIYRETFQALNAESPVLAGIGLRALIEAICKEKDAEGKNLLQQIDDLAVKTVLTPAGAGILHKLRTLGNKAAHEVKPHSEKQLFLAMDVIEHLLKDVYVLPKQAEAEFDED